MPGINTRFELQAPGSESTKAALSLTDCLIRDRGFIVQTVALSSYFGGENLSEKR